MSIQKIQAYRTSDGHIHEDESEAVRHQNRVDQRRRVEEIVNERYYSLIGASEIIDMIVENSSKFTISDE